MASIVITLPNRTTLVVTIPNGDDGIVPVQILECAAPRCRKLFDPREPHQIYCSEQHQQHDNNEKRRKTERRRTPRPEPNRRSAKNLTS